MAHSSLFKTISKEQGAERRKQKARSESREPETEKVKRKKLDVFCVNWVIALKAFV
jgi:hypothetical protein